MHSFISYHYNLQCFFKRTKALGPDSSNYLLDLKLVNIVVTRSSPNIKMVKSYFTNSYHARICTTFNDVFKHC